MFTPVHCKVCVKVKVLKQFDNENCNAYLIKLIFSERGNTSTWMIHELINIVRIQIIRWLHTGWNLEKNDHRDYTFENLRWQWQGIGITALKIFKKRLGNPLENRTMSKKPVKAPAKIRFDGWSSPMSTARYNRRNPIGKTEKGSFSVPSDLESVVRRVRAEMRWKTAPSGPTHLFFTFSRILTEDFTDAAVSWYYKRA